MYGVEKMMGTISKRWMRLSLMAALIVLCWSMGGIAEGEPGDLPGDDIFSGATGVDVIECSALWTRTFGGDGYDYGLSVQQTSDGGYIIAGNFESSSTKVDQVYLVKTNTDGGKEWAKTYGGNGVDTGLSVQQTSDGGYIIAGIFDSSSTKNKQVYLIKTNANGGKLWAKTYGGDGDDSGRSVQQTADGGYIIAGTFDSSGTKNKQVYLVKTNANGGKLWAKTYGGDSDDYGYSVQQTSDGGYIIAGSFESSGTKNKQVYLVKTNANGVKEWAKTYGGDGYDYGQSVQQTDDGGYIITGAIASSSTSTKGFQVYLVKTNANGGKLWENRYGGNGHDCGRSIQQTTDGGYIIAGETDSFGKDEQVYLIRTGPDG